MSAILRRLRERRALLDGVLTGLAAPTFVFWPPERPPVRPIRVEDAWRRVGRSFDAVLTDPERE